MPIQLRSGAVKQAPSREFTTVHAVFLSEKVAAYKKQGLLKAREQLAKAKEEFEALPNKEKKRYEELFQQKEDQYKAKLVLFYDGTRTDLKNLEKFQQIPEKPKQPLTPGLAYQWEHYHAVADENDLESIQVRKKIAAQWLKLSANDKKKYEDQYVMEHKVYEKEMKLWKEKYGPQAKEFLHLEEELYQKPRPSVPREDLQFQELPRLKRPKEPKPLVSTHDSSTALPNKGKKEEDQKRAKSNGKK